MKNGIRSVTCALLLSIAAVPASAGTVQEEEAQLRDAYGQYRMALFGTNSGNQEATTRAMSALESQWAEIADEWSVTPPPQYADDPGLGGTLAAVSAVIEDAGRQVADGALGEAHETLEKMRDDLGDLHIRNGLFSFSDRMNAYHAKMEDMLGKDYRELGEQARTALAADAAVLSYLAADLAAHPAPEAGDPAFGALLNDLTRSVEAVEKALGAGDIEAAVTAVGKLKVPYAKLFVKFG